jgi:hypothetical protein
MDIAPDPWHYPRQELARTYLRRFDPGPAEALTLFAARRSGKTAFLKNDLATAGIQAKLQPVYIDLWAHIDAPGLAIADGFEAAARTLQDSKYKYGNILGRFDDPVTSVGGFGFSLGVKPRDPSPAPADTLSRISFWADQMVSASKRPILLMIDEVQALAATDSGATVAGGLRAVLQKHNRMQIRPVFTGSSQDGLQRMFNQSKAAFFRYGTNPEFPTPDDGIAAFFAKRLKESSGVDVNPVDLLAAFNRLSRQPGAFRDMVEAMDNAVSSSVQTYLNRQIVQIEALTEERARLANLRPIDLAVLDRIQTGGQLFGRESERLIAARLGVDQINPKSINDSIDKLRKAGFIIRVERGEYRVEDHDIAAAATLARDASLSAALSSSPQNVDPRGSAFATLSERDALKAYPELRPIYDGWRNVERALMARYPADEASRKIYQEEGRAALERVLNEGKLPGERELKRAVEIVYQGVKRSELDR